MKVNYLGRDMCTNNCDKCGRCSRCGECCAATIPLTKKEEQKIKKYIELNKIVPEEFKIEDNINLQCCFYDRKNKICKIYEVRPSICRSFKCNKNLKEIETERTIHHKLAYWNQINNDKFPKNITDMRLLFYNDPRSLIGNIICGITNGTMECNEKQFEFMKKILIKGGQEELANCIEGEYDD